MSLATLAVTTTSGNVALDSGSGLFALVQNNGPSPAYIRMGNTATLADTELVPGPIAQYAIGVATHIAAITKVGTAALVITRPDLGFGREKAVT